MLSIHHYWWYYNRRYLSSSFSLVSLYPFHFISLISFSILLLFLITYIFSKPTYISLSVVTTYPTESEFYIPFLLWCYLLIITVVFSTYYRFVLPYTKWQSLPRTRLRSFLLTIVRNSCSSIWALVVSVILVIPCKLLLALQIPLFL